MNQITQVAQTVEIKQTIDFQKTTEEFDVVTLGKVNNQFNMTVTNTGDIPVHLTRLWVENTTDSSWPVSKYDLDIAIPSGGSAKNIGQNIGLTALDTQSYVMKLVTERGNTQKVFVNSVGTESIYLSLIASPIVIPTAFSTTLALEVINTGTNKLINLQPYMDIPVQNCVGSCSYTLTSGPIPAQFDSLDPGDIAIFRWVYKLNGDADSTFTFTGSLQNGVAGNTASETVTIGNILEAEIAGQSINAVGFGTQEFAPNVFVFHIESNAIPVGADYQMSLATPDSAGTTKLFDDTSDVLKWFSANATSNDATVPAGNWDASLRYNSPRLPSGMAAGASIIYDTASNGGGHTLHFNTDTTIARLDSGTMSTCTSLVDSGSLSGATWSATAGVNGTGAYSFDGDDYISITTSTTKKSCNYTDTIDMSIAGWFNGTATASTATQTIFSKADSGEGGYEVTLGDGDAGSKGHVIFTFTDKDAASVVCESPGTDYLDDNWHHFVGVYTVGTGCELYVDGVSKVTASGSLNHEHEKTNPHYIGMQSGTTNGFTGVIDDLMMWTGYPLTASDVTALFGYSFGDDAHKMNFFISNATGIGTTVEPVLKTDLSYSLPWSDPLSGTNTPTDWAGGNYTASLPQVSLKMAYENRLNFTMSYASGEPLTLLMDESELSGGVLPLSSFLQFPTTPDKMPTYLFHDNDNKVSLFIYNAGNEGAWLTYQGTRVVFNGTNGHYAGLIDTVDNHVDPKVTLSSDQDGPFVPSDTQADVNFWHPQVAPSSSPPSNPQKIVPGIYQVTIFLNGYDETGALIVRSINLGNVEVID